VCVLSTLQSRLDADSAVNSLVDPILEGTHVSKADFDALQAKYDELSAGGAADNGRKSRKRARHSTQQDMRADSEMMDGEASSTPVDEKPRKKRGMKLEVCRSSSCDESATDQQHLIHQQANQRLGIEYNVSKFESKGLKYLPDPSSTPLLANQSPNMVREMRPDFTQDVKAPTVRPFINQVVEDVIREWDGGVYQLEPVATHEKIREAVEVYWVRLAVSLMYKACEDDMLIVLRNAGTSSASERRVVYTRMNLLGESRTNTVVNNR
jgi:hypothetical protein